MTGESYSRPTGRMSRFSQAYSTMPQDGAAQPAFEEPAESVLSRIDGAAGGARGSSQRQRFPSPEPHAEVIEVDFETVTPFSTASGAVGENGKPGRDAASEAGPTGYDSAQPPPPDIEAIAAALAAEMDRNAARNAHSAEPPVEPVAPLPEAAPEIAAPEIAAPEMAPISPVDAPPFSAEPVNSASPAESPAHETVWPAESPPQQSPSRIARVVAQITPISRKAVNFTRSKAGPAVVRAGFWLARNLRRKELRRRYGKAIALTHSRVLDRRLEQHFFVPSLKTQRFAPDPERSILYEGPVPSAAFGWALSALPQDLREYAFVDLRAGLGRAMLLASQRRFERIIGYEYDAAAYDDLQMNIAQFPRSKMVCRDVQCFRGDRSGVSIPDQPCVLYVANAWREEFLDGIMGYLGEAYRHKPRRVYIILENVDEKVALPKDDIFYSLDLPRADKLKLRLFSPMDFKVYRTQV